MLAQEKITSEIDHFCIFHTCKTLTLDWVMRQHTVMYQHSKFRSNWKVTFYGRTDRQMDGWGQ